MLRSSGIGWVRPKLDPRMTAWVALPPGSQGRQSPSTSVRGRVRLDGMEPIALVVGAGVALLWILALAFAITQVWRHPDLNDDERVIWTVAVLLFPLAGAIVWFVLGAHPLGLRFDRSRLLHRAGQSSR